MAKLSAAARRRLKTNKPSDFVFPEKAPGSGSYPMPDRKRAESAVKMAMAHLSGEQRSKVLNAVARRYPELKEKFKDLPGGDDRRDGSDSRRRTALKAIRRRR